MSERDNANAKANVNDIDVSVVMACYTEERLDGIRGALTSLCKQSLEPRRVIVAVDNNEALAARLREEFEWVTVVLNQGSRGASATRNSGVEVVDTTFTAFFDDDQTADPDWLLELTRPFADADVVGAGGRCEAVWSSGKPWWFPDEFAWAVGASYAGMPTEDSEVRNVWSGNMAVRTAAFRKVGGFSPAFGKCGSNSLPEDTELCIRMSAASAGRWIYVPAAVIHHDVPTDRASFRFFTSRCFAEGGGKAMMSTNLKSDSAIDVDRGYVRATARTAVRRLFEPKWPTILQSFVMMIGLASAAAGYLRARLRGPARAEVPAEVPRDSGRKPALVIEYDVATPVSAISHSFAELDDYERVWTIVRAAGKPIGIVDAPASIPAIEKQIMLSVQSELSAPIAAAADTSVTADERMDVGPIPSVTVAICTRERPDDLARLLDSLLEQNHQDFSVIVVDNAPIGNETRELVDRYHDRIARLDYVVEPKPGLSHARNCALRHVNTEVVAWIDDDETADPDWLGETLNVFRTRRDTAAVSGLVVPAELETRPQWWFEQYGGHSKGRGFTRAIFPQGDTGGQSPLYPLPPFGVGANMAFRTSVLADIGGFDNGLGAGTATFGGEDTLIFSQLLLLGKTVVYEPAAMTRHFHRRTLSAFERQMYGYGVGLTAYYIALLRWNWRLIFPLVRLLPQAVVDMLGQSSAMTAALPDDFPGDIVTLKRRGMLVGPVAYWRARRSSRAVVDR